MHTEVQKLTDTVRETAFSLHCYLKNGLLEKVYKNGLAHRLRKKGLKVKQQCPIRVYDEDRILLGEYFANLVVEELIIIEPKAVKTLADEHTAQVLAYFRSAKLKQGILLNFGNPKLQIKKLAQ